MSGPEGARRPLRVMAVNGSYESSSKTGALLDLIGAQVGQGRAARFERIDVADLGTGLTGALRREDLSPRVLAAVERVESADLLVAGTPVYQGSYSGLFKLFFDFVDQYALAGHLVLLAATGGGEHHAMVIDHELRPLFGFFQAAVAPVGVYASAGDFDGTMLLNPQVYTRIEVAVGDLAPALDRISQASSVA